MSDDLLWGLYMTAAGMGTVFALLLLLMAVLMLIGRLDRRAEALAEAVAASDLVPDPEPVPHVSFETSGLDADTIAAITIAVLTHREVRRQQAAPEMRSHQPGSHLYASRWVAHGRGTSSTTWRRS